MDFEGEEAMARAEVRTCEVCGQKFDGYSTSRYCRECRLTVQKETQRQARERYKAAEAAAKAKQLGEKLDREMKEEAARRKMQAAPNTEQCEGCSHWRALSSGEIKACHHLVDTDMVRLRDGDHCFSRSTGAVQNNFSPWGAGSNGASVTAGTKKT